MTKEKLTKNCIVCNNLIIKIKESKFLWNRRKFCSKECANKDRRGKLLGPRSQIEITCLNCNIKFTIEKHRIGRAKYCSRLCKTNHLNKGLTKESERVRKSKLYKNWRISVFERDNYTCVICGARNEKGVGKTVLLNADHILPFASNPELRLDVSNGRTLCVSCHRKTDTFGTKMWKKKKQLNDLVGYCDGF